MVPLKNVLHVPKMHGNFKSLGSAVKNRCMVNPGLQNAKVLQNGPTHLDSLLELIHADVCGPFPTQSLMGSKYFLTFIDDKSRRIFVYIFCKKNEVLSKFKEFKNLLKRKTDRKLKFLPTDDGENSSTKSSMTFFVIMVSLGSLLKITRHTFLKGLIGR